MREFLTLKTDAFGLDISDLSLKIIKLKKKDKFFDLVCFGKEEIKPGIIEQGEIKDERALAEIIKNALIKIHGEKIKTKYVIASLPEEKSFLQIIQMPIMPIEDLKSAIIYEAENYIPLPIKEAYLDFQIIKPIDKNIAHFDILIAALPKNIVNSYVSCFKMAGLKPLALEIEALAISRALIKDEITTEPVLLIDFGQTKTSFIIFSGNSIKFTSFVLISFQEITEIISQVTKVDLGENDFIKQIKKYLDYYQSHISRKHFSSKEEGGVRKIFLCGGGANLKGLTNFLSQEIGLPVEIGNPWVNVLINSLKKDSELFPKESLGYTTAIGLALRAYKEK